MELRWKKYRRVERVRRKVEVSTPVLTFMDVYGYEVRWGYYLGASKQSPSRTTIDSSESIQ